MSVISSGLYNDHMLKVQLTNGELVVNHPEVEAEVRGMCTFDANTPDIEKRLRRVFRHSRLGVVDRGDSSHFAIVPRLYRHANKRDNDLLVKLYLNSPDTTELNCGCGFDRRYSEMRNEIISTVLMNSSVTKISLDETQLDETGVEYLCETIKTHPSVRDLQLARIVLDSNSITLISTALKTASVLESLSFTQVNFEHGDSDFETLVSAIEINSSLKRLTFDYALHSCNPSMSIERLNRCLGNNSKISFLSLRSNELKSRDLNVLLEGLDRDRAFLGLDLGENDLGKDGLSLAQAKLVNNFVLTCLDLSDNRLDCYDAEVIASILESNQVLRSLDISDNKIKAPGGTKIGLALAKNTSLTCLDLSNNKIGDQGVGSIGGALKFNRSLTTLGLRKTHAGDVGARRLIAGLLQNDTLTNLQLLWMQMSPTTAQEMRNSTSIRQQVFNEGFSKLKKTMLITFLCLLRKDVPVAFIEQILVGVVFNRYPCLKTEIASSLSGLSTFKQIDMVFQEPSRFIKPFQLNVVAMPSSIPLSDEKSD